jgi:hypothetical protein
MMWMRLFRKRIGSRAERAARTFALQCPRCKSIKYFVNFCPKCGLQRVSNYDLMHWWDGKRIVEAKREAVEYAKGGAE